jgi:hypothetical protein
MDKMNLKKIKLENWLEPDPVMNIFKRLLSDGKTQIITKEEWLKEIYNSKLTDFVSNEIHDLVEVARGTMTYGYYYYPIFTFAVEQFTRIAETAISKKCEFLNAPKSIKTFNDKFNWLSKLPEYKSLSQIRWESIRKLRNKFSHPSKQSIIPPGIAIELMNNVIDEINTLYK